MCPLTKQQGGMPQGQLDHLADLSHGLPRGASLQNMVGRCVSTGPTGEVNHLPQEPYSLGVLWKN